MPEEHGRQPPTSQSEMSESTETRVTELGMTSHPNWIGCRIQPERTIVTWHNLYTHVFSARCNVQPTHCDGTVGRYHPPPRRRGVKLMWGWGPDQMLLRGWGGQTQQNTTKIHVKRLQLLVQLSGYLSERQPFFVWLWIKRRNQPERWIRPDWISWWAAPGPRAACLTPLT